MVELNLFKGNIVPFKNICSIKGDVTPGQYNVRMIDGTYFHSDELPENFFEDYKAWLDRQNVNSYFVCEQTGRYSSGSEYKELIAFKDVITPINYIDSDDGEGYKIKTKGNKNYNIGGKEYFAFQEQYKAWLNAQKEG